MGFDIAVIVSSFERPWHLERCLASLEAQVGVEGRFEAVVADDGSQDGTLKLVTRFARQASFPLTFTTHEHLGFRLSRCRNEGVAASEAPYLLFTDGDCVLPPDHLFVHLDARRPGTVVGSDCVRLDAAASRLVDADCIREGRVERLVPGREMRRILGKAVRAKAYQWLGLTMLPRLSGNNIAVWRHDFLRVNGFDERFVGWGFEDRDFQDRLERIGVRTRSILWRTAPIHLWHPPASSFARNGVGTANLAIFRSDDRPPYCADGFVKSGDAHEVIPIWMRQGHARRRAA